MRIQSVRIIPLKKEYTESLEGQDLLTKIVDKKVECSEVVTYEEGSYAVSDVAMEADAISEETMEKAWVIELFMGVDDFRYPYTYWEIELKTTKPSKEQIAEYIVNHWWYDVDPDDTEEIDAITKDEEFSFHDMVCLRSISSERTKELLADFDKNRLIAAMKQLEIKLNQMGIYVDDLEDSTNSEFLDELKSIFQKAVAEDIGVLYIIKMW